MSAEFILASASPRRKALLEQIGITPDHILPADIDETPYPNESASAYVMRVASEKAAAIAANKPGAFILAADTVVACGRRILPKAEDEQTARDCLKLLSGRRHRVMTGCCLMSGNQTLYKKRIETVVRFRRLTQADIDWYIATNEWDGKAGGYGIQGAAQAFIPFINGSFSGVVGLPLAEIQTALANQGISGNQAA